MHAGGTLWLRNLTVQNGTGDFDGKTGHEHGGAIHNHGTLTLDHVAVINSSTPGPAWGGGAITNASTGVAQLSNVTIARNSTGAQGGGIENLGELRMLNVTIAENSAPAGKGGGIYSTNTIGTADALVAKNTSGGDCAIVAGTVTSSSLGPNLAGDGSCHFNDPNDLSGDPGFDTSGFVGPLFYPLLATSQAVDTGVLCQFDDIRGVSRPQDGNGDGVARCDTGSYERETDTDGDGVADALDNCPSTPNAGQANLDGDSLGDACDPDRDGDGVLDTVDSDGGAGTATAGFSDSVQGKANPTTGSVVSGSVMVEDVADPTKGVRVTAVTDAVLSVCGPPPAGRLPFELDVPAGMAVTVTCSSVIVEDVTGTGAVTVKVPGGLASVKFPAGTAGTVNSTASGATVTAVSGTGVTLTVGGTRDACRCGWCDADHGRPRQRQDQRHRG